MKRVLGIFIVLFTLMSVNNASAQWFWKKKKKQVKTEKKEDKKKSAEKKYKELLKDAKTQEGLFKVHQVKDKYYFEISKDLLKKDMLFSSRVSSISNNVDVVAGQMPTQPLLIEFSADKDNVYMHMKSCKNICDKDSEMYESYKRNNVSPIWKAFGIKTLSPDSTAYVIEVTKLFSNHIKELSPFRSAHLGDAMRRHKPLSGSFNSKGSKILKMKSFPKNLNIKSRLNYTAKNKPFTATLTRNIILLPETPMRPRIADKRIGYFKEYKYKYTEDLDHVQRLQYINRWNIQPKKEDIEKYKRGELVEPEKPIVWYVDTAIPEKWRKYVRKGIEDWQIAFEAIGFKNAIVAKDYPKNDPDFDPDDIRYSCYRFITTTVQNSMGPSWVDPRSGEILTGDVIFYSNVVNLLHNWRFVQTATVDPKVRKEVFDEETMGQSLQYVAAHEVGHTLGLMHNFGASFAYPVDSLRSATFTKKYGTTPSIMDYARYNYVAQPGDKGVSLNPPKMGVYDIHSIKWGYKPIFDANTPEDEYETLNKWIVEKQDDPMYDFGPQPFGTGVDPSCQSESVGNDMVKATRYGVKNLKLIMKNLKAWTTTKNKDYTYMKSIYKEVVVQFERYLVHVFTNLGGMYIRDIVAGDGNTAYKFVSKKKQRESLKYAFKELMDMQNWLIDKSVVDCVGPVLSVAEVQNMGLNRILYQNVYSSLAMFEKIDPKNAYTNYEFLNDVYNLVFEKTIKGKKLDYYDRNLQYGYLKNLLSSVGGSGKRSSLFGLTDNTDNNVFLANESPNNCSCSDCSNHNSETNSAQKSAYSFGTISDARTTVSRINYYLFEKVQKLIKKNLNKGTKVDRMHYKNLNYQINKVLKK